VTESWFSETLYPDFRQVYRVDKIVFKARSEFQDILVFETPRFGRVLALDGIIQTTEKDEFCYHEMIAHVPLFAHGAVRNVLIIGGGDGGALEEVLKHPVKTVTMVELDDTVMKISREYLPAICRDAFDDPRLDLKFMDGTRFVKETDEKFDVIMVDSTDPVGPGKVLFTGEFYTDCAACLNEAGILVTQSGVTFMQNEEAAETYQRMKSSFTDAGLYITQVPSYGAGYMTFGWGCHSLAPRRTPAADIERRFATLDLELRYYSPRVHAASFALPTYIEALKG
jgi:spermidine synthase